jgi:hypothetical protein
MEKTKHGGGGVNGAVNQPDPNTEMFEIGDPANGKPNQPLRALTDADLAHFLRGALTGLADCHGRLTQALTDIQRYGGLANILQYETERRAKTLARPPVSSLPKTLA